MVRGTARCQSCRWTHPFVSSPEPSVAVEAIVSEGPASTRTRITLPAGLVLRNAAPVELPEIGPVVLTRIDRRDGRPCRQALSEEVATLWAVLEREPTVRVALVEGDRSSTMRLPTRGIPRLEVGARFRLGESEFLIAALRARNHTWRRPGDAFPVAEVSVVYARRTERPPAGRRRWSTGRGIPSSRTSSSSIRERSRSGPGVRRARTTPRARTADGGATVHRSSSS